MFSTKDKAKNEIIIKTMRWNFQRSTFLLILIELISSFQKKLLGQRIQHLSKVIVNSFITVTHTQKRRFQKKNSLAVYFFRKFKIHLLSESNNLRKKWNWTCIIQWNTWSSTKHCYLIFIFKKKHAKHDCILKCQVSTECLKQSSISISRN